ncbi:hypothetical protein FKM82_001310 [Ascaphus truei]
MALPPPSIHDSALCCSFLRSKPSAERSIRSVTVRAAMFVSPVPGSLGRLRRHTTFFARTLYTARSPDFSRPNWLRVSMALGSTVAVWALLFKQHSEDVAEYKKRNGLQ